MTQSITDYLAFPLDVASVQDARELVRILDGHVGYFKIGLELFIDQGPRVVQMVREQSRAKIFLDLKLHDISATVGRAMERVAGLGVELVTVHTSSSFQMLENAVRAGKGKTGVLGVTLLTDNDAAAVEAGGFRDEFVRDTGKLVMLRAHAAHRAGCAGVVCSGKEAARIKARFGSSFMAVTPGIRPQWSLLEHDDQKRVTTPARAIAQGSDLLVIGRPIRDAKDPAGAARKVAQEIRDALA